MKYIIGTDYSVKNFKDNGSVTFTKKLKFREAVMKVFLAIAVVTVMTISVASLTACVSKINIDMTA
jgi:hypothetical protein